MSAEVLDRCDTPQGEFVLRRRGRDFEVVANGVFLMSTRAGGGSERRLVRAALARCPQPDRLLIGGLGLGFSLAEAVSHATVRQIVVVEIEAAVLRWHRTHLAHLTGQDLADPRVRVVHADLRAWLRQPGGVFDAICLDVDNGPDWTMTPGNAELYRDRGVALLARRLAAGGVLAVWSAHPSDAFAARLRRRFADVWVVEVPASRGEPDCLYLARRRPRS